VVVHHNGGGGIRFDRGSTGVVVGSDEVGAGRRRARAREEAAAVAVGSGRKTIRWDPRIIERGRLAGWAGRAKS
jgi:hypothetical protein